MTVISRRIRATPQRSSSEVWAVIVDLLTTAGGQARADLSQVGGIAASLIASEAPKHDAIVVHGAGPRVRVYCLYDQDAITGDNASEQSLPASTTDGDWSMSLPCPGDDLKWVQEALARKSTRVTARKCGEAVEIGADQSEEKSTSNNSVDKTAFFRP